MSKYHELQAEAGKGNWTTADGAAAMLRDRMRIEGYGVEFQIWRDGLPLNEATARRLITGKLTTRPVAETYLQAIRDMVNSGRDDLVDGPVAARVRGTRLMFEHGDFKYPMNFRNSNPDLEVVIGEKDVARKLKRRNKGDIKREERSNWLQEKLDKTQDTDGDLYLLHAEQCGYLARNTAVRFYNTGHNQYGVSTMTKIYGITLPELQDFVDSAGNQTLSDVSTHADTSLEKATESGEKERDIVEAGHSDFTKAIVDFLDIGFEVDVDGIKREHAKAEEKSDSRFQPIKHWGADEEEVLKLLIARRSELNPDKIRERFTSGYKSEEYQAGRALDTAAAG